MAQYLPNVSEKQIRLWFKHHRKQLVRSATRNTQSMGKGNTPNAGAARITDPPRPAPFLPGPSTVVGHNVAPQSESNGNPPETTSPSNPNSLPAQLQSAYPPRSLPRPELATNPPPSGNPGHDLAPTRPDSRPTGSSEDRRPEVRRPEERHLKELRPEDRRPDGPAHSHSFPGLKYAHMHRGGRPRLLDSSGRAIEYPPPAKPQRMLPEVRPHQGPLPGTFVDSPRREHLASAYRPPPAHVSQMPVSERHIGDGGAGAAMPYVLPPPEERGLATPRPGLPSPYVEVPRRAAGKRHREDGEIQREFPTRSRPRNWHDYGDPSLQHLPPPPAQDARPPPRLLPSPHQGHVFRFGMERGPDRTHGEYPAMRYGRPGPPTPEGAAPYFSPYEVAALRGALAMGGSTCSWEGIERVTAYLQRPFREVSDWFQEEVSSGMFPEHLQNLIRQGFGRPAASGPMGPSTMPVPYAYPASYAPRGRQFSGAHADGGPDIVQRSVPPDDGERGGSPNDKSKNEANDS